MDRASDANRVMLEAAGEAARKWSSRPLTDRVERLRSLRLAVVARLEEIAAAVSGDAGKVRAEALLTDLLPSLEVLLYNEKNAERVLSPEERPGSLIFPGTRAEVRHEPWGVVLVISPWNNPFQLSLLPAATALLAGNAVVLKPSERSPAVSVVLREVFGAVGLPAGLVHVVDGGPQLRATALLPAAQSLRGVQQLLPGRRRHPSGQRPADHLRVRAHLVQQFLQAVRSALQRAFDSAEQGAREAQGGEPGPAGLAGRFSTAC